MLEKGIVKQRKVLNHIGMVKLEKITQLVSLYYNIGKMEHLYENGSLHMRLKEYLDYSNKTLLDVLMVNENLAEDISGNTKKRLKQPLLYFS